MLLTPMQTAFTSGEFSPKLWGRYELDAYAYGASYLENFIATMQGPIVRRCGCRFLYKLPFNPVLLIPFIFSTTQSCILALGGGKGAVFYNQAVVVSTSDSTVPYTFDVPWTDTELKTLQWAQAGDILWCVCGTRAPTKIMRYGWTDWRIQAETFINAPANWTASPAVYPRCITFHEQRLVYASTTTQPQTVWCSRIGIFNDFTRQTIIGSETRVEDTDAIWYTISSDDTNRIQWMLSTEVLLIGTGGAEFKAAPSTLNETITPNNVKISKIGSCGSNASRAVNVPQAVLFIQRGETRVKLFEFDAITNAWKSTTANQFADHMMALGISKLVTMTAPEVMVLGVLKNGQLVGFTYDKTQKVSAWHRLIPGGGSFIDAAVIPGDATSDYIDQCYVIARRNSVNVVCSFGPLYGENTTKIDTTYPFLDFWSCVTSTEDITSVGGAEYLTALGLNSAYLVIDRCHADWKTINADGTIDLPYPGKRVEIGIRYFSRFVSLDVNSIKDVTMGKKKRIVRFDAFFLQSLGLQAGQIGPNDITFSNKATQEVFFGPSKVMNKRADLFTGMKTQELSTYFDTDVRLVLETWYPYPMTIRDIKYHIDVGGV